MSWAIWLAGAAILFLPGAYLFRAGKPKIIRVYLLGCTLLLLAWVFDLGASLDPELAHWPKMLLAMLAPGTLLLAVLGVQRDRERVMGATREERDALATAAVLYGAGHHHASDAAGDMSDAGDAGGGDA